MQKALREYERHQSGWRFHVREYNGGVWQVHGRGLEHICDCLSEETAEMVADVLEAEAVREQG
jgi:hypothetical protein